MRICNANAVEDFRPGRQSPDILEMDTNRIYLFVARTGCPPARGDRRQASKARLVLAALGDHERGHSTSLQPQPFARQSRGGHSPPDSHADAAQGEEGTDVPGRTTPKPHTTKKHKTGGQSALHSPASGAAKALLATFANRRAMVVVRYPRCKTQATAAA